MSPELIQLHLSQLTRVFERSKTNKYADARKQEYHDQLSRLLEKIRELDLSRVAYIDQIGIKYILDFCFLSIEFLDNSTLVNIPYEMVYCLEKVLNEWDGDRAGQYIIVTSLQNNITNYSFNPTLVLNEPVYDLISAKFGISFSQRLIQINLPKYLANDYLANVVLYHELGHFIDLRYQISTKITKVESLDEVQSNHVGEFFSDIFASQYIGLASNHYLNYIAHKFPACSTHPSTDDRMKIVEDFLNSRTDNEYLNIISYATQAITGKELSINACKIDEKDFLKFVPSQIKNDSQLQSIFETGWQLWMGNLEAYEQNHQSVYDKYRVINNLIEKSISNYMILENWNKNVPDKK